MPPPKSNPKSKPTTDRPMRQTRARSKLNNAPPLMQGLDRRGRAQGPLSADPEVLAYNDVVQKLASSPISALKKANIKIRRGKKVAFRSKPSNSRPPLVDTASGSSGSSRQSADSLVEDDDASHRSSASDNSGDDSDTSDDASSDESSNHVPGGSNSDNASDQQDSDMPDAPGTPGSSSSGSPSPSQNPGDSDDTDSSDDSSSSSGSSGPPSPAGDDDSSSSSDSSDSSDSDSDSESPDTNQSSSQGGVTPGQPVVASPSPDPSVSASSQDEEGIDETSQDDQLSDTPMSTSHNHSGGSSKKRRRSDDDSDDDDAPPAKRRSSPSATVSTARTATQSGLPRGPPGSTSDPSDHDGDSPANDVADQGSETDTSGSSPSSSGNSSPMIMPTIDPEIPGLYSSGIRARPHYDWYEQYHSVGLDCTKVHGCAHNPGRGCHECHADWQMAWARYFKAQELLDEAAADPQRYLKETGVDLRLDFMGILIQGSGWQVLAPELQPPAGQSIRIHPTRLAKHMLAFAQLAI